MEDRVGIDDAAERRGTRRRARMSLAITGRAATRMDDVFVSSPRPADRITEGRSEEWASS
jgi:hypothetical protein